MKQSAALLLFISLATATGVAYPGDFTCPDGLAIERGEVPHPWFDDIAVPSAWCIDKAGEKNGPWWGWEPDTKTLLFRTTTLKGQPHGMFRLYFTNGRLAENGRLQHGKRVGKWVTFNPDGTVKKVVVQ